MKKKKEKTAKVKKGNKFRDYLVFLIIAVAMIFLTSSFVVENIYSYADRISTSPEGVAEIYEISIGQREKLDSVQQTENEDSAEDADASKDQDQAEKNKDEQPQATPSADENKK